MNETGQDRCGKMHSFLVLPSQCTPSKLRAGFCCFVLLCFLASLSSLASRGESQTGASAALKSEADPRSLLLPVDGTEKSSLASPF